MQAVVYIWADGIHVNVRLEEEGNDRQCLLVVMGVLADGTKELIAVTDGFRESKQSWYELLVDLRQRGLTIAPRLAVGDGALGFWAALPEVFPGTREQRCWVHKTANVLNKMPKSLQANRRSPPSSKDERKRVTFRQPGHDVQTGAVRRKALAEAQRTPTIHATSSRKTIRRWLVAGRRLTFLQNTTIENISLAWVPPH